ncbi:MAG: hypothetical protein HRU26_04860, partial [Psychroserpens sp.]|nr:hypothetical protein [Psychroserpens sp.]
MARLTDFLKNYSVDAEDKQKARLAAVKLNREVSPEQTLSNLREGLDSSVKHAPNSPISPINHHFAEEGNPVQGRGGEYKTLVKEQKLDPDRTLMSFYDPIDDEYLFEARKVAKEQPSLHMWGGKPLMDDPPVIADDVIASLSMDADGQVRMRANTFTGA